MSNKLAERPQTPKEFDPRKQDHGTRGTYGSFPNDGSTANSLEAKWNAYETNETADIVAGLEERYVEDTAEESADKSYTEELIESIPEFDDVRPVIFDAIEAMKTGRLDRDDVVSFYKGDLYNRTGKDLSYGDVDMLLYELMDREEIRKEDEAYAMNDKITAAYRGEGHRSVNPDRPTNRTRNRNLVRMAENLVDPEEEK